MHNISPNSRSSLGFASLIGVAYVYCLCSTYYEKIATHLDFSFSCRYFTPSQPHCLSCPARHPNEPYRREQRTNPPTEPSQSPNPTPVTSRWAISASNCHG